MEQNTHGNRFRLRTRPQTQECILLWLDEFGLRDADDEAVACLVKRLDTLDAPFDHDPERIEAFIGDLIEWVSATVDSQGRMTLLAASATVSEAFVKSGLAEEPRCVFPPKSPRNEDEEPTAKARREADTGATVRPMRRDLIYAGPVEVKLADGSRGSVLHPPFDGRVMVKPRRGRSRMVPLDDLADGGLQALRAGTIRRRVEVHSRCSVPSCSQAIRLFLSENTNVESIDGERECGIADLFWGRCPKHTRKK